MIRIIPKSCNFKMLRLPPNLTAGNGNGNGNGDDRKNALPWAKSVAVDKGPEAYANGEVSEQYLTKGRAELRRVAAEAVRVADQMKPMILEGPLHQYPVRKAILFLFRNVQRIKARYFAPDPNDEGAVRAALTPESR